MFSGILQDKPDDLDDDEKLITTADILKKMKKKSKSKSKSKSKLKKLKNQLS